MEGSDFDPASVPLDRSLQRFADLRAYVCAERLPWATLADGRLAELRAVEAFPPPMRAATPLRAAAYVSRRDFERALRERFADDLTRHAVHGLRDSAPAFSARPRLTAAQGAIAVVAIVGAAALAMNAPVATFVGVNLLAATYFLAAVAYRALLVGVSFSAPKRLAPPPIVDDDLPPVTILLPVHREAECLPTLRDAILRLDYPAQKLDVKLLLEAHDEETAREARRLSLDRAFDMVVVPPSAPQTKPKACNFALPLARGALVVIYDAEDEPEPDQLRKAAAAFAAGDASLACLQARLNYYNRDDNWLAQLFTLEYAHWFDAALPALERLGLPIPLGGTSNILRTETLAAVGGWDPYNVTEDADLGFRLARLGHRTEVLDSTTFEEASAAPRAWLRQRSRWMKGHLQTWLVHMRQPLALRQSIGWGGVAALQFFLAGNVFSALISPLLWIAFLVFTILRPAFLDASIAEPLFAFNVVALLTGNLLSMYLLAIAPVRRGWLGLSKTAVLAPLYWLLASVAAYRALWQFAARPFFWEKTPHMRSPAARARREAALGALGGARAIAPAPATS